MILYKIRKKKQGDKLQNLVAARRRQMLRRKVTGLEISMEPGGSGFLRENENIQNARTN